MADKATTTLLESLSNALFGKKHEWRKLTKRGVMVLTQSGDVVSKRLMPLTESQAKDFMVNKLKARQERIEAEKKEKEKKDV